jgi:hypothetical protein
MTENVALKSLKSYCWHIIYFIIMLYSDMLYIIIQYCTGLYLPPGVNIVYTEEAEGKRTETPTGKMP